MEDEILALQAIFSGEKEFEQQSPHAISITIVPSSDPEENHVRIRLDFKIPRKYPNVPPHIHVVTLSNLKTKDRDQLESELKEQAETLVGDQMIYPLCEHAREFLQQRNQPLLNFHEQYLTHVRERRMSNAKPPTRPLQRPQDIREDRQTELDNMQQWSTAAQKTHETRHRPLDPSALLSAGTLSPQRSTNTANQAPTEPQASPSALRRSGSVLGKFGNLMRSFSFFRSKSPPKSTDAPTHPSTDNHTPMHTPTPEAQSPLGHTKDTHTQQATTTAMLPPPEVKRGGAPLVHPLPMVGEARRDALLQHILYVHCQRSSSDFATLLHDLVSLGILTESSMRTLLTPPADHLDSNRLLRSVVEREHLSMRELSDPGLREKKIREQRSIVTRKHIEMNLKSRVDELFPEPSPSLLELLQAPTTLCPYYVHNFIELENIGRGAFGEVVKVQNRLDGKIYAIKKIRLDPDENLVERKQRILREVTTLSRLQHENIVRYFQAWIEGAPGQIVRTQADIDEEEEEEEESSEDTHSDTDSRTDTDTDTDTSSGDASNSNADSGSDSDSDSDSDDSIAFGAFLPMPKHASLDEDDESSSQESSLDVGWASKDAKDKDIDQGAGAPRLEWKKETNMGERQGDRRVEERSQERALELQRHAEEIKNEGEGEGEGEWLPAMGRKKRRALHREMNALKLEQPTTTPHTTPTRPQRGRLRTPTPTLTRESVSASESENSEEDSLDGAPVQSQSDTDPGDSSDSESESDSLNGIFAGAQQAATEATNKMDPFSMLEDSTVQPCFPMGRRARRPKRTHPHTHPHTHTQKIKRPPSKAKPAAHKKTKTNTHTHTYVHQHKGKGKGKGMEEDVGELIPQLLFIQMEFCPQQTLDTLIRTHALTDPVKVWNLFQQIAEGLAHVHEQAIVHRDLKPQNIFIHDEIAKIGDFGLAFFLQEPTSFTSTHTHTHAHKGKGNKHAKDMNHAQGVCSNASGSDMGAGVTPQAARTPLVLARSATCMPERTTQVGTFYYCAPELATGRYSDKVDLYSLGIILFEMWYHPFDTGMERFRVMNGLKQGGELPPEFARFPVVSQIIRWLLKPDPKDRPSAKELLTSNLMPPRTLETASLRNALRLAGDPYSSFHAQMVRQLFSRHDKATPLRRPCPTVSSSRHGMGALAGEVCSRHGAKCVPVGIIQSKQAMTLLQEKACAAIQAQERDSADTQSPTLVSWKEQDSHTTELPQWLLMSESGELLSLRNDLTTSFAAHVARYRIHSMKRFDVNCVWRPKSTPSTNSTTTESQGPQHVGFEEQLICAFDIISHGVARLPLARGQGSKESQELYRHLTTQPEDIPPCCMLDDAECLKVAVEMTTRLVPLSQVSIRLGHAAFMRNIWRRCKRLVSTDTAMKREDVSIEHMPLILDTLRQPWELAQRELSSQFHLAPDSLRLLRRLQATAGPIQRAQHTLPKLFDAGQIRLVLIDFQQFVQWSERLGIPATQITLDPTLAARPPFHTGLGFQVCVGSGSPTGMAEGMGRGGEMMHTTESANATPLHSPSRSPVLAHSPPPTHTTLCPTDHVDTRAIPLGFEFDTHTSTSTITHTAAQSPEALMPRDPSTQDLTTLQGPPHTQTLFESSPNDGEVLGVAKSPYGNKTLGSYAPHTQGQGGMIVVAIGGRYDRVLSGLGMNHEVGGAGVQIMLDRLTAIKKPPPPVHRVYITCALPSEFEATLPFMVRIASALWDRTIQATFSHARPANLNDVVLDCLAKGIRQLVLVRPESHARKYPIRLRKFDGLKPSVIQSIISGRHPNPDAATKRNETEKKDIEDLLRDFLPDAMLHPSTHTPSLSQPSSAHTHPHVAVPSLGPTATALTPVSLTPGTGGSIGGGEVSGGEGRKTVVDGAEVRDAEPPSESDRREPRESKSSRRHARKEKKHFRRGKRNKNNE